MARLNRIKYCECGCRQIVNKPGNRFINGHNHVGSVPWNKGLTKATDDRIKIGAEKSSNSLKGRIVWNKGTKGVMIPWNKGLGKKNSKPILCGCGCGEMASPGKEFVSGHYWRGKKRPEETRKKMRKPKSEEHRKHIKEAKNLPEAKDLTSKQMKERMLLNPPWNKGLSKKTDLRLKKHSKRMKKRLLEDYASGERKSWNKGLTKETDERLNSLSIKMKNNLFRSEPAYKRKMKRIAKKNWKNPKYRDNVLKGLERSKDKRSKAMIKKWEDPVQCNKWLDAICKGRDKKPNKLEKSFLKFLNTIQPGEWKYTGNGGIVINRKIPDFINVNGQKKIIEVFGNYWHKGQDPKDRIKVFKPFGYQTLVIWEKEFKGNLKMVAKKVQRFLEA